jgi:hypothetical protein
MKKNVKIFLLAFSLFWFFNISLAGSFSSMRCCGGKNLVNLGDHASVVLAKCGEPISMVEIGSKTRTRTRGTVYRADRETYRFRQKSMSANIKIEEWTYCKTRYGNGYLYILRFKGDVLTKITSTGEKCSK